MRRVLPLDADGYPFGRRVAGGHQDTAHASCTRSETSPKNNFRQHALGLVQQDGDDRRRDIPPSAVRGDSSKALARNGPVVSSQESAFDAKVQKRAIRNAVGSLVKEKSRILRHIECFDGKWMDLQEIGLGSLLLL